MKVSFNPFPGLRPFDDTAEDTTVFFGRDDQVDELLERLRQRHFVGVVGPSGCGKSSLVRAGLLPALHEGFMAHAGSVWRIAVMRPGNAPIESLAQALGSAGVLENVAGDPALRVGLTSGALHGGARGLVEIVSQARLDAEENVLVVVDQFEELFRFRYSAGSSYVSDEAAAFVKLLLTATDETQTQLPMYVLITMRSDFIGDCAQFRNLPETLNQGLFLVPRLTRSQLEEAIEGPVRVAGATIAPRLLNRLLNARELGDDPDQLPVLQHALMRTWNIWRAEKTPKRPVDVAEYEATGGLSAALSQHGDEILTAFESANLRAIAERVFKALTELGSDNRGVRRPTPFAQLCAIAGASTEDVRRVVDAFRAPDASFLMPPAQVALGGATVVDLTHEALMRNWSHLRSWVEEEAESAKLYRRLRDHADLYDEGKGMLLADPLLSFAEEWRAANHPTQEWSERYGGELARVSALIESSRASVSAESERLEEAERRERDAELERTRRVGAERLARRTRGLAGVMSVIAVLAIGAAAMAAVFDVRSNQAYALAHSAELRAVTQGQRAQAARVVAERNAQRATVAESAAHKAAGVARAQEQIAQAQAAIARRETAIADAAQVRTAVLAGRESKMAQSLLLAGIDHGMYVTGYDDRVAGLVGADAYALSPTGDARAALLTAAWTPNALGRVALPPWNLGAVTGHGRYVAVLAGGRQTRYGEPVTGSFVTLDATTLAVLGRIANVRVSLMCGFDEGPRVALAEGDDIALYDIGSNGRAARAGTIRSGSTRALGCLPGNRVAFVDAGGALRVATTRSVRVVGRANGNVDGIALSHSGRYAAVTTSSGNVGVYDLQAHREISSQRLLTASGDCGAVSGCSSAVAFTPDDKQLAWYSAGAVHVAPIAATADASYTCAKNLCGAPGLLYFPLGATIPTVVAAGGVLVYDADRKEYAREYSDGAGTQSHPILDRDFGMYFTPYDPNVAAQPNPFHGGLAAQSFSRIEGPLLGTIPSPQWVKSYALRGHDVFISGDTGYIDFDLDHLRENFESTYHVSYHVRMADSGDGKHAVGFNMFTGMLQVVDIRPAVPVVLHQFQLPAVPVKNGYYQYFVQAAFDPQSNVVTTLSYSTSFATLRRYSVTGRLLSQENRAQLLSHLRIVPSSILNVALSARGHYLTFKLRAPASDAIIRSDGTLVGRAFSIDLVASDERLAIAEDRTSEGYHEAAYDLPHWTQSSFTIVITPTAEGIAISPDRSTVAYYADDGDNNAPALHLYDLATRETYRVPLPNPPDISAFTGVSFSADGRYLLATYSSSGGYYRLAVYAVDPSAWARAACLMAGRSLSAKEFRSYVGRDIVYHDGCMRYAGQMYRW